MGFKRRNETNEWMDTPSFSFNHQAHLDCRTHNVYMVVYTINVAKTAHSAEFVSIKRQNGSLRHQNTVSVRIGFVTIFVILYNNQSRTWSITTCWLRPLGYRDHVI